jgi:hypothetical protein
MKKLFLIILFTLFFTPSFAERETMSATILQSQAFKGRVKEIIQPDSSKGIKHTMVVINDNGKEMSFILTPGLGVYGSAWEVLSLKKINLQDKVLVEYTTNKNGDVNKAISIMITGDLGK